MKIGRVTVSDRAFAGVYLDRGGPEIERNLRDLIDPDARFLPVIIPDERERIAQALRHLADQEQCSLIVTTGGTGLTPRDVTPDATRSILERELPGFGELMRIRSFDRVPTSILSRAIAGTRGRSLIINLPGKPSAVTECLGLLAAAIREALAHLAGEDPHASPQTNRANVPPVEQVPLTQSSSTLEFELVDQVQDARGVVFEPLHPTQLACQQNVHVVLTHPGGVRGNHYHLRGTEILTVVGPALVRVREKGMLRDIPVQADAACRFMIPPGIPHAVLNTGTTTGFLVAFNSEPHDPRHADTVREMLIEPGASGDSTGSEPPPG
jgi:molybdopterin adenylyltransferase